MFQHQPSRHPRMRTLLAMGVLSAVSVLSGCASYPKDEHAPEFKAATLMDAPIMPVIDEERGTTKVVVVDAPDAGDGLSRQLHIGKQVSQAIEEALSARSIEVVDDALAPRLDDALRKSEALSDGKGATYAGPKVARYAIRPMVTASNYSAAFHSGTQLTDPTKKPSLLGAVVNSSAGYTHRATVSASVRVYEMPTLRLVGVATGQGSASLEDPRQAANGVTGAALLKDAVNDAVRSATPDVLNLIAIRGYVVQRRFHPEKKMSAYMVTLGVADGVKAGDKVTIFTLRPHDNDMLKSAGNEEIPVATGVISAMLLTPSTSWVVLDDEAQAPKIHKGDLVKTKHERSLMDKLTGGKLASLTN